jgi:hypothetical protein
VEENSCGHLLLDLLWKETSLVVYCWNYRGRKQPWSFTDGITVERSSYSHLLLELLRKGMNLSRYEHSFARRELFFVLHITL